MEAYVGLNPEDKEEVLQRLVSIDKAINSISEFADEAAVLAKDHEATGLAFSLLMLKEAIKAYGVEMNKWAKSIISS
jgi:hypothetical protein